MTTNASASVFIITGIMPWVSIGVTSLRLLSLIFSCCCIVKQCRLLNRMAASALAVNRPLQARRVGPDSSRAHLAGPEDETSV